MNAAKTTAFHMNLYWSNCTNHTTIEIPWLMSWFIQQTGPPLTFLPLPFFFSVDYNWILPSFVVTNHNQNSLPKKKPIPWFPFVVYDPSPFSLLSLFSSFGTNSRNDAWSDRREQTKYLYFLLYACITLSLIIHTLVNYFLVIVKQARSQSVHVMI